MRAHIDLFSGIGGFALAARWVGIQTVQFVEIDPFCRRVLKKNFPGVLIHDDIKTFNWTGQRPFILTGGFPCQPFSCAGKRRGKEDDRYLWPEMLRVIQEARPAWVIGENVAGFISMGLDDCISDLEDQGYEVQVFVIPACAVNAPHRRDRVWIVGNLQSKRHTTRSDKLDEQGIVAHTSGRRLQGFNGLQTRKNAEYGIFEKADCHASDTAERFGQPGSPRKDQRRISVEDKQDAESITNTPQRQDDGRNGRILDEAERSGECGNTAPGIGNQDAADTGNEGLQGGEQPRTFRQNGRTAHDAVTKCNHAWSEPWPEVAARLCGMDARVSNRVDRLKALGNAIVPQVAAEIMKAIMEASRNGDGIQGSLEVGSISSIRRGGQYGYVFPERKIEAVQYQMGSGKIHAFAGARAVEILRGKS